MAQGRDAQTKSARLKRVFGPGTLQALGIFAGAWHFVMSLLKRFTEVSPLRYAELGLFFILGAAAVAWYMLYRPKIRVKAIPAILLALLGWFALSCALMGARLGANEFLANRKYIMDTLALFGIFFPLGYRWGRTGRVSGSGPAVCVILACWTVFISYVLINVLRGVTVELPGGGRICMDGMGTLRLNCHYNTTGALEMLFFLVSLALALSRKGLLPKAAFGLASAIHYTALVLSNSRTAYVSALFGFVGIVFVYVRRSVCRGKRVRRLLSEAAVIALLAAGFYLMRGALYSLLMGGSSQLREVIDSTTASFTGRTDIWAGALRIMVSDIQYLLFGVTPAEVRGLIKELLGYRVYTHNQFLETGVALGAPAMLALGVWVLMILAGGARQIRAGDRQAYVSVILILTLLLANTTEATLMFYEYATGHAFFLLCGRVYGKTLRNEDLSKTGP
ncbi:MAG: O-antigen ligase family protein [Clostridia bacterium]|nr:O-antigen ligase family protein [Clostridia bacterium]